ncbi:MAG: ParB/RepB/Spo0J family partition protein [Campylobacterota bacterium]|nr:ParB/RepB/Spo0J family partition protein [Campylobacterota bacterium]
MAKLNLDSFKNNVSTKVEKQETQGIFKEHHNIQETLAIDELESKINLRLLDTDTDALKHSIETLGQIEPIVVRSLDGKYEILDGNRRLSVAKALGLHVISVNIIKASDSDALFLPYLLNAKEGFDIIEIASYLQNLKENHNISNETILKKTGLHVNKYSDLFSELKGDALQNFNTHYDELLHKYFRLRDGAFDIGKDGVSLKIAIDSTKANDATKAEVYRFIHKLSNL